MSLHNRRGFGLLIVLSIILLNSSCASTPTESGETIGAADSVQPAFAPFSTTPSPTPFQPLLATEGLPTLVAEASPTAQPSIIPTGENSNEPAQTLWMAPNLPPALLASLVLPQGWVLTDQQEGADLLLEVGDQKPVSRWIYALVAPFPTIVDSVTDNQLINAWNGKKAGPFSGHPILMDEATHAILEARLGAGDPNAVEVMPADKLLDYAWKNRPSWAIVPFEDLEPRLKVLAVNGENPIQREFNPDQYPLAVPISLSGEPGTESLAEQLAGTLPVSNRDESKLAIVVLTGVTAMVRATAYTMERDGITSPAQDIKPWLKKADIAHISNEVPFAPNCPFPNPQQPDLKFCSKPSYIELLEDIGTDIVELTGDHFADWGAEATLYTLDMYRERGWPYYGGGRNIEEGRKPVLLEVNGNRIAFIGCNAKGGGYATASENTPGAVACDYDWMRSEIRRLKRKGYLVIATFQHQEIYAYMVGSKIQDDFITLAEAGADIVSGSQAHQPHGMQFYQESFLHFGLGNLFFDQYRYFPGPETDQAFIDRHIFYDGRYISTELLPIQFVNLARSRPMTPEEKEEFLAKIFAASGW